MVGNTFKKKVTAVLTIAAFSGLVFSNAAMPVHATSQTEKYTALDKTLGSLAVNAKVDRVWHAIPGLSGWKIDTKKSDEQTKEANDGKLHLVWSPIPPTIRLDNLSPEPIYRGPQEERSACLMINVSWGEEYVPALLKIFEQEHVKGTFFLDGSWVKKNRDLARKIVEGGHAIGSHGYGHPDFRKLSDADLNKQVISSREIIYHELGTQIRCIAPPSGSYDDRFVKIAKREHIYTILWSADTLDWQKPEPSVIVNRVRQNLSPGVLVLMHPTASTVVALPNIIRMLKNDGYQLKTVDSVVMEDRAGTPPATLSVQR